MLQLKIKEYFSQTKVKGTRWVTRFYNIGTDREISSRKFQFLFASWFSLLIFFTFFILAEKNPFNLLVPFNVFQLPHAENRTESMVFVSDGNLNQIPVQRRFLRSDNLESFIFQLIGEIGSPPYFSIEEAAAMKDIVFNPKKLLDLQFALRKVWFRSEESVVIMDWDTVLFEKAMLDYRLPQIISSENESDDEPDQDVPVDTLTYYSGGEVSQRESEEVTRTRRLNALSATLRAIDATLFINFPKLKKIQHTLNGRISSFPPLKNYKLEESKLRN